MLYIIVVLAIVSLFLLYAESGRDVYLYAFAVVMALVVTCAELLL